MNAAGDCAGFLVDGFPRNQDNLEGWERQMKGKVSVHIINYRTNVIDRNLVASEFF